MADRVIIVGARRAKERIPATEIKQMAGRAGRVQFGSDGIVDIIVGESDIDELQDDLDREESFEVHSIFGEKEELSFHLLPEIVNLKVRSLKEAQAWYNRSFNSLIGGESNLEEAIHDLLENNAIVENNGIYAATALGQISAQLYFSPVDVNAWKNNFDLIFNREIEENDVAVAWALATVHEERRKVDVSHYKMMVNDYGDQVSSLGLDISSGTLAMGVLWWNILGGPSMGRLKNDLDEIQKDFGRIHRALVMLNSMYAYWNKDQFLDNLQTQVRYKVPNYLVQLCKIEGVGKIGAYELYNMGIKDLEDCKNYRSDIESLDNQHLANSIKRALHEVD
jgi:replicative superfamily II helicase